MFLATSLEKMSAHLQHKSIFPMPHNQHQAAQKKHVSRHNDSIQILVLHILEKRFTAAEFFSNELVRTETNSPARVRFS
jgi:hypothetical protein